MGNACDGMGAQHATYVDAAGLACGSSYALWPWLGQEAHVLLAKVPNCCS